MCLTSLPLYHQLLFSCSLQALALQPAAVVPPTHILPPLAEEEGGAVTPLTSLPATTLTPTTGEDQGVTPCSPTRPTPACVTPAASAPPASSPAFPSKSPGEGAGTCRPWLLPCRITLPRARAATGSQIGSVKLTLVRHHVGPCGRAPQMRVFPGPGERL